MEVVKHKLKPLPSDYAPGPPVYPAAQPVENLHSALATGLQGKNSTVGIQCNPN